MDNIFKKALKRNIGSWLLVVFFGIMFSAALSLSSLTLMGLMELVTGKVPNPTGEILPRTLLILGAFIGSAALYVIFGLAKSSYIYKMTNDLRSQITEKIINTPFQNFDNKNTGNYISWYTTDINEVVNLAVLGHVSLFQLGTMALFSFSVLTYLNMWLGLIALGLLALTIIVPQLFNGFLYKAQQNLTKANEGYSEDVREAVGGFNLFYISDKINTFKSIVGKAGAKREAVFRSFNRTKSVVGGVSMLVSVIAQIGMMVVTIVFAVMNLVTVGAVLSAGNLAGNLFNGIGKFVQTLISYKSAKPILEKFQFEPEPDGNVVIQNIGEIALENIEHSYGEKKIFTDFSLRLNSNKKYAVIGDSGTGKTTLLKMMLGLLNPDSGAVQVAGTDLADVSRKTYLSKFAYIDQNVYLFKGTLRENITMWRDDVSDEDLAEIIEKVQLTEFMASKPEGLGTYLEEGGKNISGGERQRIALARALVNNIQLVIIDESTSQLDESNAVAIESMLLDQNDFGVIMVSHHFKYEIISRFDEVINLNKISKAG